jgi:hypothetical protein
MSKNVGALDRWGRGILGAALVVSAVLAPLSLPVRLLGFGLTAGYLFVTALSGTCLGYRLMGRSTCPRDP